MNAALLIASRELRAMMRTPVAYVVGVAFLVVQGLSFAWLVEVLSDPARPAPLGAVLEGYFGGTLLHWALQILVVSALAMRTIAEDRRAGTWEVLLTAPVGEGAVVVGKWLGALAYYALLWLPTLAYLGVIAAYSPPGAGFDPGPVAAAYLGELVVGASFLAVGVAASAATSNQIVAAVVSFTILLVLLVLGEARDLQAGAGFAEWARAISVREHLAMFARGEIALAPLVFHAGLTVTALSAAMVLARVGRRRGSELGARAIATGLCAVIATLACVIAVRHPRSLDVTAARLNTLDAATRAVLARVDDRVDVAVLRPGRAPLEPVYREVERAAARMAQAQPLLRVRRIDPALESARAAELAREAGVGASVIEAGGGVLVSRGDRRRVVFLVDLAEHGRDPLLAPTVTRLRAEEALAEAVAAVIDDAPATVCVTSGHGELPIAAQDDGLDASLAVERLRRDGIRVDDIGAIATGVPATCRVLAVLGPRVPLSGAELLAAGEHVERGGGLLVAASSRDPAEGQLPPTGLEPVLARHGLALPSAVVVDAAGALDLPTAFGVVDSYGDHPAVRGFAGWRTTVWQWARPVIVTPVPGVTQVPLVATSPRAWATRDVAGAADLEQPTDTDLLGPLWLAVSARGQAGAVVAIGSAESLSSAAPRAGIGAGDLLLAAILGELAGRARPDLALPDKTPAQVRLVMTRGARLAVTGLCVVVLPLGFAGLGTALALWRRRRRS